GRQRFFRHPVQSHVLCLDGNIRPFHELLFAFPPTFARPDGSRLVDSPHASRPTNQSVVAAINRLDPPYRAGCLAPFVSTSSQCFVEPLSVRCSYDTRKTPPVSLRLLMGSF